MDPFIGEIRIFGFNYAPLGWAMCEGQIIPIQQNTALFALLGKRFGGNGTTTFGLPNFAGAMAMGMGQGPGLARRDIAATGGSLTVGLNSTQLAVHNHAPSGAGIAGVEACADNVWSQAQGARGKVAYAANPGTPVQMNVNILSQTGGTQPHTNIQPCLPLNFCIALQGTFPIRP